jgi:hypothetical protein
MKSIPLCNGQSALVDDQDYAACLRFSWYPHDKGYARAYVGGGRRSPQYIYLHQFIGGRMGLTSQVDHKDRNGLNCQRDNLRPATDTQNRANSKILASNTSGYKGVSWHKRAGKWAAAIQFKGKKYHLGLFHLAAEAAEAYNAAAVKFFGEYASLNEIPT